MNKVKTIGFAAALLLAGSVQAQELTAEQSAELLKVSQGFSQQATVFEGLMKNKLTDLALELQREDRLENEAAAKEASKNVNMILTDLSQLYGEFIKTKVNFILEAKNVLSMEQKLMLLSQLTPQNSMPYETISYLQPDVFDLPLNLSLKQEKKIIALEADLLKAEVDIERDVELTLLDLRVILMSGHPQPEKVDPMMKNLAELAGKSIDNRVQFFINAKDVLTLDQKRLLAHMLGLN